MDIHNQVFQQGFKKLKEDLQQSSVDAITELLLIQKSRIMMVKRHKLTMDDLENHLNHIVLREKKLKQDFVETMSNLGININEQIKKS